MTSKKMDRRTFIKGVGAAGLTVSSLGFPATIRSATRMSEVPIAVVEPMTGPTGSFGQQMLRGWYIAVDEINAAGGIKSLGGAKIKTELRDTQGNPRIGMAEVEKVAQDKRIPIIVGCWGSAVTYPVTQVSEQYGIPHILETAAQTDILRRGFKYVFRYGPAVETTAQHMVEFVEDMGKVTGHVAKRAALMSVDDNWGRDCAKWLKMHLGKTNQQVVEEMYHPLKVTNVDVEIAKLKAAKPDVLYCSAFLNDFVLITRALHAQKINLMGCVTWGGASQPDYMKLVGDLAHYLFLVSKYDFEPNRPLEVEFEKQMMARYGVPGDVQAAMLYGIAYLIKDVLERAGTIDRDKVREALAATHIATGNAMIMPGKFIRFDDRGENIGSTELVAQNFKGKWRTVWPLDWKRQYNAIWPVPKWEEREEKKG